MNILLKNGEFHLSRYFFFVNTKLSVSGVYESITPTFQCTKLAIHKNWKRSILRVVPLIYWNTIGNLTVQIRSRYQLSFRNSGSIEGTALKITNIHSTFNDCSCPLIDIGGVTPWFKCHLKTDISAHGVDPVER